MNKLKKLWHDWQYFKQWRARRLEFNERLDRIRCLELMRYSAAEIYTVVHEQIMARDDLKITIEEIGPLVQTIAARTQRGNKTVSQALDAFVGKR